MPTHAPARPTAPCVRCGHRPRMPLDGGGFAYICAVCHLDPMTDVEVRDGLRIDGEGRARRYMVDRHGWAGGWTR
jgi:hypothetical protein